MPGKMPQSMLPVLEEIRVKSAKPSRAWSRPVSARSCWTDSQAQIVELTLRITLCGFFNRFNDALQIDNELADAAHDRAAE
jgi:hypothetical protein